MKPITRKRFDQLTKGRVGDANKVWRLTVLARDGFKCQFPGCKSQDNLQVHHIKRYSKAKHLRIEPLNGITLCKEHHQGIHGKEELYEMVFFKMAVANTKKAKNGKENNQDTN